MFSFGNIPQKELDDIWLPGGSYYTTMNAGYGKLFLEINQKPTTGGYYYLGTIQDSESRVILYREARQDFTLLLQSLKERANMIGKEREVREELRYSRGEQCCVSGSFKGELKVVEEPKKQSNHSKLYWRKR